PRDLLSSRQGRDGDGANEDADDEDRFGGERDQNSDRSVAADEFTILCYTIGRVYWKDGRSFVGTRPSKQAVNSLLRRIHDRTTTQWYPDNPSNTVVVISRLLRRLVRLLRSRASDEDLRLHQALR